MTQIKDYTNFLDDAYDYMENLKSVTEPVTITLDIEDFRMMEETIFFLKYNSHNIQAALTPDAVTQIVRDMYELFERGMK